MASNVLDKTAAELVSLREQGLTRLYSPESGDETTMRRIAKGRVQRVSRTENYLFDSHVAAARSEGRRLRLSAIFLLGAGGVERTEGMRTVPRAWPRRWIQTSCPP